MAAPVADPVADSPVRTQLSVRERELPAAYAPGPTTGTANHTSSNTSAAEPHPARR
ncbi:MAG: hypothetical protein H0V15_02565 [Solirubrobacterales bacterium]|nr:hypothetical protein [Solirubrobacterales bacterium]